MALPSFSTIRHNAETPRVRIESILSNQQKEELRTALAGYLLNLCFGAGVDSTAMMVALRSAGIRPDVITFADTGGERQVTIAHVHAMNRVLRGWGWPLIDVCVKKTLPTTGYTDLYGNCWKNETLPSLAFGLSSCSVKWKQDAQDQLLKGVSRGPNRRPSHPVWLEAQETGQRIAKLIGYDCGPADLRRAKNAPKSDADFNYLFPLQVLGWSRADCVDAISRALGPELVPVKSACFFCPATKQWELFSMAATDPDLLERALRLEYRALTGKHSRFDEVEFGATWEDLVRNAERFPSSTTTVGLGRSFAWNHWARVHSVVDEEFRVLRDSASRQRFLHMADSLRRRDNALDARSLPASGKVIPIRPVLEPELACGGSF